MKTNTLLLLLVTAILMGCLPVPVTAQENVAESYITVSGTVRDRTTNERLESASISAQGTNISTVTNADGYFTLKIPRSLNVRNLTVEDIGYNNGLIIIGSVDMDDVKVRLTPNAVLLPQIDIFGGDATRLVMEAIDKIADNYSATHTLLTGFYRETIQKRNRFINVAEAVIDISKTPYTQDIRRDRVRLFKGRRLLSQRSKDTLTVKLEGGPTLSVAMDLVKNRELLFDVSEMANYRFSYGLPVMVDNREHLTVDFSPIRVMPYPLYQGTLYIDKETGTVSRAEFKLDMSDLTKATQTILRKKPAGLRFKPEEMAFTVVYKRSGDRSYLHYVSSMTMFRCDWKKRLFSTRYTVHSEMVVTDREDNAPADIAYRESFRSNQSLDDKVTDFYDEDFWGQYNIIEPTESLERGVKRLMRQYD